MNKGNAESRLTGLERIYTSFQVNHEKILKLENLDMNHAYLSTHLPDLVEDSFFDRRGDFLNFLEGLKPNSSVAGASNSGAEHIPPSTVQTTNVSLQQLPNIDLPKFSGKFSDWENFRDVYRAIIHRRDDLSPIMKLHFLRTNLTGEALEKIKSLPISDES